MRRGATRRIQKCTQHKEHQKFLISTPNNKNIKRKKSENKNNFATSPTIHELHKQKLASNCRLKQRVCTCVSVCVYLTRLAALALSWLSPAPSFYTAHQWSSSSGLPRQLGAKKKDKKKSRTKEKRVKEGDFWVNSYCFADRHNILNTEKYNSGCFSNRC